MEIWFLEISSVPRPVFWVPCSRNPPRSPVCTFTDCLKLITWLLIAIVNYCQSRKALTFLLPPPFLCCDYTSFKVGQRTQCLHRSLFICSPLTPIQGGWRTPIHWSISLLTDQLEPGLKGAAGQTSKHRAAESGSGVHSKSWLHSRRKGWATGDDALNTHI